ncbi:hypothetical protein [Enhygromyxa salina]|uniref:Uncharacterized protein n=1 Tax=Enhygromyxa salina TaxID=215803 RepID=A0A2S9Y3K1_9BACT|nr:hypothetical protein [Enhygromyxa salina]PRP99641.1 hypothetical protein ENSA7_62810 [Enhygromyxa salina]
MNTKYIILPVLSLMLVSACSDESDGGPEATRSGEIGELVLANGNILVFVDQDPSDGVDIMLIEIAATPEPGGAIEEMKAAGATPAELWLSASGQVVPRALEEAHVNERAEAPHVFTLPEHLRETDDDEFRAFAYGGAWGDYDGYCNGSFASDWDAWAGTADASSSGTVGYGATVDLYMDDATDAWVGVCNNTPWDTDVTFSKMSLFRDISGNPTWSNLLCSAAPSASWCLSIGVQVGKGMHFWSGTTYDFKAQAAWSAGVAHDTKLRVRSE